MSAAPPAGCPRVLILGRGFDAHTGAGVTLGNLFAEWPRQDLALVARLAAFPEPGNAASIYALGKAEEDWRPPLAGLRREPALAGPLEAPAEQHGPHAPAEPAEPHEPAEPPTPGGPAPGTDTSRTARAGTPRAALDAACRKAALAAIARLGADQFLWRATLSAELAAWIRRFDPQVVYTNLESLALIRLARQIQAASQAALVVHMMDDWPASLYHEGLLSPLARHVIDRELRALLRSCSARLAVSDAMAAAYLTRYRLRFEVFANGVDVAAWAAAPTAATPAPPADSPRGPRPRRLVYVGRIGRANASSLHEVAVAAGLLRGTDTPVTFDIYSPDDTTAEARRLALEPAVGLHGRIAHEAVPATLASADLLVLPLDHDRREAAYARFSMPTKAVEYMASGRPILVYAPASHALALDARDKGWAEVVGARDPALLAAVAGRLLADPERCAALGAAARALAAERHDLSAIRARFREVMNRAADTGHREAASVIPAGAGRPRPA